MKQILLLTATWLFFNFNLQAQDLISHTPFDNGMLFPWTSTSTGPNNWDFDFDGTAESAIDWDSRPAIISPSEDGDNLDTLGVLALEVNEDISQMVTLTSPIFNCVGRTGVYLRFNQYYGLQSGATQAVVEVSNDDGGTWEPFDLEVNNALDADEETNPWDVQEIDISAVADGQANVQIRFVVDGNIRFWIIDDVYLYEDRPPVEPIAYLGDSLSAYDIPYDVDSTDWPIVPYQIVVEFNQGVSPSRKDDIRDSLGFARIDSCVCDELELWQIDGEGQLGAPFDINERVMGASAKSEVNGADLNKINFNDLQDNIFDPADSLISLPQNITAVPSDAVIIAVLDTGIDFSPSAPLTPFIWQDQLGVDVDGKDSTCYDNDYVGWNFVHRNNNPSDDHRHGTHVAGIIANNYPGMANCDFRILPVKTHDEHGTSTLYNVSCGTYYAVRAGANIINDSWGAYGKPSTILTNAIAEADNLNVLIVTSAGNDELELGVADFQYPACFDLDNVITVGSYLVDSSGIIARSDFSNFGSNWVDIMAIGDTVSSFVPGGAIEQISGTSQSTPAVSAMAAYTFCLAEDNIISKDCVLDCAIKFPQEIGTDVRGGNVLNLDLSCVNLHTSVVDNFIYPENSFELFPNPTEGELFIKSQIELQDVSIFVMDVSGRILQNKKIEYFNVDAIESIDVEQLIPGMYFLQIRQAEGFWTSRFIKH